MDQVNFYQPGKVAVTRRKKPEWRNPSGEEHIRNYQPGSSQGNAIVLNDGPSSDSSDSSDSDAPQNGPCSNKRIFSTTCYNSSGKPAQLGAVSEIQDRQEAEPTAEQSLVEELDNFWGMHNTADKCDFVMHETVESIALQPLEEGQRTTQQYIDGNDKRRNSQTLKMSDEPTRRPSSASKHSIRYQDKGDSQSNVPSSIYQKEQGHNHGGEAGGSDVEVADSDVESGIPSNISRPSKHCRRGDTLRRPTKRSRLQRRHRFSSPIASGTEGESDGSQASEYDGGGSSTDFASDACFISNSRTSSTPLSLLSSTSANLQSIHSVGPGYSLPLGGFLRRIADSLVLTLASQSSSAGMTQVQVNSRDMGYQASAQLEYFFAGSAMNVMPQRKVARTRAKFTAAEDELLIDLKVNQGFPGQTRASLQVRYSTKLKRVPPNL